MADEVQGQQQATSDGSQFNAISFIVHQLMGQMATATLVQVKSVTNAGGVSPVGTVSVQPMVSQTDGAGNGTPHGIIYNVPYFRLQGGANAVILDPVVDDIGMCVFASTDLSSVKATGAPANPSSQRRYDWADGLYIGGFLNGTPQQYIQFSSSGITLSSPTQINLVAPTIVLQATETIGLTAGTQITNSAPAIELDGEVTQGEGPNGGEANMAGPVNVETDVVIAGKSVGGHFHTQPNDGAGDSEADTSTMVN